MSISRFDRRRVGYSLTEVGITMAVLAVAVVIAVPRLNSAREAGELRDTALALDGAMEMARGEAIRTGDVQLLFVFQDAEGNPLVDANGDPVSIAIVNDGAPGSADQNCRIDAGESMITVPEEKASKMDKVADLPSGYPMPLVDLGPLVVGATPGAAQGGVAGAPLGGVSGDDDDDDSDDGGGGLVAAPAPDPSITGSTSNGSSFSDPSGNPSSWVMFRPEGMPVSFDAACNLGDMGSGAGTFYLHNEGRYYAVALSPMGTTKVLSLNTDSGEWK